MPSVNLGWRFNDYPDVSTAHICRATTLNSEKAFEDVLNGVSSQPSDFQILEDISVLGLTNDAVYTYTDTTAGENTTYYYCVAVKGSGTSLYKVGLSTLASTTEVTTSTALGSSSVAAIAVGTSSGGGGGGGGSTSLVQTFDSSTVQFVDFQLQEITQATFFDQGYNNTDVENIFSAYVNAWSWINNVISLPDNSNAQTIQSFLYIIAGDKTTNPQGTIIHSTDPAAAVYQAQSEYTMSGSSTKTFGDTFPSVAAILVNAAMFTDPVYDDPDFWKDVIKHEIAHTLGFSEHIMFPTSSFYSLDVAHNNMVSYDDGGQTKYYWQGANALREYKNMIPEQRLNADNVWEPWRANIIGIPMEDGFANAEYKDNEINAHWKEGWGTLFNGTSNVVLNDTNHPVLNREALSSVVELPGIDQPFSRITGGYFQDMGYEVDLAGCDVHTNFWELDDPERYLSS